MKQRRPWIPRRNYFHKMIGIFREQQKTVIVIAYRLSTVFQADKIVVLENGKVAEEGSHKELLRQRRQYYQLWKNQFPMGKPDAGC